MDFTKQNFLSVDKKTARSSYGEFFTVGETVGHQDKEAGIATITSFEFDEKMNEVFVLTDKGYAYLDFIEKREDLKEPVAYEVWPNGERLDLGKNRLVAVFRHENHAKEFGKRWGEFFIIKKVTSDLFK